MIESSAVKSTGKWKRKIEVEMTPLQMGPALSDYG